MNVNKKNNFYKILSLIIAFALLYFIFINYYEFYGQRFAHFEYEYYNEYGLEVNRFGRWMYFIDNINKIQLFSSSIYIEDSFHNMLMDAMMRNGYMGGIINILLFFFLYKISIYKKVLLFWYILLITVYFGMPSGSIYGLIIYSVFINSVNEKRYTLKHNII